jgi:hypothetical protein
MKWNLTISKPHEKTIGYGILSVVIGGYACFSSEDTWTVLASMERVRLEWAAAEVVKISGFEAHGYEKNGNPKFIFQEWFLRYPK